MSTPEEITMSTVSISEASRQLSRLVNRVAYGKEVVVITTRGKAKAVLLGVEAFEELVGMRAYAQQELIPLNVFQPRFQKALAAAGVDTSDKVVDLVRQVKREQAAEHSSQEDQ
jgi:prevent-host-death family protein